MQPLDKKIIGLWHDVQLDISSEQNIRCLFREALHAISEKQRAFSIPQGSIGREVLFMK
jgi:hypothetical protein